jgi:hypothetical protein
VDLPVPVPRLVSVGRRSRTELRLNDSTTS